MKGIEDLASPSTAPVGWTFPAFLILVRTPVEGASSSSLVVCQSLLLAGLGVDSFSNFYSETQVEGGPPIQV